MRVAVVSPGYPPARGGVEMVVARTARALVRAGVRVDVLADERDPRAAGTGDDHGVTVRRFACNRAKNYRLAPGLWRYLRAHRGDYDVVHAHSYHAPTAVLAASALATRAPGAPAPGHPALVVSPHYHGTGHSAARALLHRLYRPIGTRALVRARSVVCVSHAEADLVAAHFPQLCGRIEVVPNGVDVRAIRAGTPRAGEPPTVLAVGRLEAYKRVELLIEAFALAGIDRDTQLVIIGDGPQRSSLLAVADRLGVRHRVRVLPGCGDRELHGWLRTARVFAGLSEREAYGLAPAEALVAGIPAVLSAIPAHRELAGAAPPGAVSLVGTEPSDVARALRTALRRVDHNGHSGLDRSAYGAGVLDWDQSAAALLRVLRAVRP